MMEAGSSFEMLANICETTQCNIFMLVQRELFISFVVACCSYGTNFTGK
jgi:hypothetical protein